MRANTRFEYKGHKVIVSQGIDNHGAHWTVRINGRLLYRNGSPVKCSASLWAQNHAKEAIDNSEVTK